MSAKTGISWTDSTWNVLLGCDRVSPGCDSCYAIRTARRMGANPNPVIAAAYAGLVEERDGRLDWTGRVNLLPGRMDLPLRWARPRRIFVNAQSDLFHDDVPDEFIAQVWAVMAATPHHTYQVLTKRHGRMRSLLSRPEFQGDMLADAWFRAVPEEHRKRGLIEWPLRNVWLGVSVEDQRRADLRIPALLDTPAAVRWLSCEPLLGPVELERVARHDRGPVAHWEGRDQVNVLTGVPRDGHLTGPGLDWVVVGGESGPSSRRMDPLWSETIQYQCARAGVPFFYKQTGEVLAREWSLTSRAGSDPGEWPVPYPQEYAQTVGVPV